MSEIAFSPIDIETPEIELAALQKFSRDTGVTHYTNCWRAVPLIGRFENNVDWYNPDIADEVWLRRNEPGRAGASKWANNSDRLFPELVRFFSQLPFSQITHCYILEQLAHVPAHYDVDSRYDENLLRVSQTTEPRSYKFMLFGGELRSFFMTKTLALGDKVYPRLPPKRNCFVVSETLFPHGADFIPGAPKFVASIFGILDPAQHEALLKRSIEKFSDYVIRF